MRSCRVALLGLPSDVQMLMFILMAPWCRSRRFPIMTINLESLGTPTTPKTIPGLTESTETDCPEESVTIETSPASLKVSSRHLTLSVEIIPILKTLKNLIIIKKQVPVFLVALFQTKVLVRSQNVSRVTMMRFESNGSVNMIVFIQNRR